MTFLFADSFDHYDTNDVTTKWTNVETGISGQSIAVGLGRHGSNAWNCTTAGRGLVKAITNSSAIVAAVALNVTGAPSSANSLFEFREGSTVHVALRVLTDLSLQVTRSTSTVLATSAAGVVPTSGYCFIEFKANIHDSTGTYEVRVNGTPVITGTGADTRNGGTGIISNVALLGVRTSNNCYFEDVYILNTSGSAPWNDFLGDIRIDAGRPNGNGNSSQLTGSDGNSTDNYLLVDETNPNGDTDYVQSSTSGQKDTYAFPNMAHTPANIYGVQVCVYAKKDDAGARSVCSVTRSGGADTDGATQALSTSYRYYLEVLETDPATAAAWTQSGYNAAEFGLKVAA